MNEVFVLTVLFFFQGTRATSRRRPHRPPNRPRIPLQLRRAEFNSCIYEEPTGVRLSRVCRRAQKSPVQHTPNVKKYITGFLEKMTVLWASNRRTQYILPGTESKHTIFTATACQTEGVFIGEFSFNPAVYSIYSCVT